MILVVTNFVTANILYNEMSKYESEFSNVDKILFFILRLFTITLIILLIYFSSKFIKFRRRIPTQICKYCNKEVALTDTQKDKVKYSCPYCNNENVVEKR